jgi:hypothetical protein
LLAALLADESALAAAVDAAASDSGAPAGAAGASAPAFTAAPFASAAALPAALQQSLGELGASLHAALQARPSDLLAQGALARATIDHALAGSGLADAAIAGVIGSTVQRAFSAALTGTTSVRDATLHLVGTLRAGHTARIFPGRQAQRVSLDRDYPAIVTGSYCLLDKSDHVALFKVSAVSQGSRAEFAVAGKSSYLKLDGQDLALFEKAVRETTVSAQSEALALARAPLTTPVAGGTIQVAADVAGLEPGRRVLVNGIRIDNGATLVHSATLQSATLAALAADGSTLVIDPPLPAPLVRASTVVYGNVARASHGKTVAQVLGAGDASQPFQRFELKHAPLTYRSAPTESGAASELTVRVADVEWTERGTLYGAGPTERAYQLELDEQGKRWVQFGDGTHGARLPSGVNNVRARYRKGIGAEGNVRADTLTQLAARPLGLKSVANLAAAEGGTDPEPASAARRAMPLATRTLGRAVSLLDYEDFARAYAGVAKAQAAVLLLASGPTVAVTIAGPDNAFLSASNPVWRNLLDALTASGDPHVPVRLLTHQASTFRLGLKVKCDPAYEAQRVLANVEAALRAHYAFDARELAQPVHQSEVIAVAHRVPGVLAVDLDVLYGGTAPAAQTVASRQVRLLASRMRVADDVPRPAEILTLDPRPLDRLEAMA